MVDDNSEVSIKQHESTKNVQIVALPVAVNRINPNYPHSARRHRHEGRVTIEVEVAVDGRVNWVRVVESSGFTELDAAAVAAAEAAEFRPAQAGDQSVVGIVRLPIEFKLVGVDDAR